MNEQATFDFWDSTAFKKCRVCGNVKHHDNYHIRNSKTLERRAECKDCRNAQTARLYARRARRISNYKQKQGCVDCGYNEHPAALQFDHVNRESKHMKVSAMITGNLKKLFEEIRKCQIRCANCHAVKTIINKEHLDYWTAHHLKWRDEENKDA